MSSSEGAAVHAARAIKTEARIIAARSALRVPSMRAPESLTMPGRAARSAAKRQLITTPMSGLANNARRSRAAWRRSSVWFAMRGRTCDPLDVAHWLVGDRFSWDVLTMAARLATKPSFAEACATLASFVPDASSTEVIENTVLGLGRHTADWFEQAPAPEGDGEVLVMMFDSEGVPTATDSELSRAGIPRSATRPRPSSRSRPRAVRGTGRTWPRRQAGSRAPRLQISRSRQFLRARRRRVRRPDGVTSSRARLVRGHPPGWPLVHRRWRYLTTPYAPAGGFAHDGPAPSITARGRLS